MIHCKTPIEWKKSVVSKPTKNGWQSIQQYECPICGFTCNIEVIHDTQQIKQTVGN